MGLNFYRISGWDRIAFGALLCGSELCPDWDPQGYFEVEQAASWTVIYQVHSTALS